MVSPITEQRHMIRQHLAFHQSGIYAVRTVYILFITPESTGSNVCMLARAGWEGDRLTDTDWGTSRLVCASTLMLIIKVRKT